MKKKAAALVCLAAAILLGCGFPDAQKKNRALSVKLIHKSPDCGIPEGAFPGKPFARWIEDRPAARQTLDVLWESSLKTPQGLSLSGFSFSEKGLLWVHMGRKPTTGYRLELIPGAARIKGRTAVIALQWVSPPPDAMVGQMITRPCILLGIARRGFSRIEVRDQAGALRAAVDLAAE
jgi:hypothetical protein